LIFAIFLHVWLRLLDAVNHGEPCRSEMYIYRVMTRNESEESTLPTTYALANLYEAFPRAGLIAWAA
jgi:hypothetical protein